MGSTKMSAEKLEARRKQAGRLFARGFTQSEVARRLGVSRQSAMRWHRAFEKGGAAALRSRKRGRPARLSEKQLAELERALLKGPQAHGWSTDLWTLERIGLLIRRLFGEAYHRGHVWRIMRSLHWSMQRPARRARERDEQAIERWKKETWPRLKKTAEGSLTSFSWTKVASRKAP